MNADGAYGKLPLELRFTAPDRILSLNDRDHHQTRARRVAAWRSRAAAAGLLVGAGPRARAVGPAVVEVELSFRDRRTRDAHNFVATVKPIIDGLVDAGLWPDDNGEHVATLEPVLVRRPDRRVVVRLLPLVCSLCTGPHHAAKCDLAAWANIRPNVVDLEEAIR